MKHKRKSLWLASALAAAALAVAACGGGGSDDNSGNSANTVPDSAGVSSAAFVAFIMSLNQNDESSEPLLIKDSLAVPADETDNVLPTS